MIYRTLLTCTTITCAGILVLYAFITLGDAPLRITSRLLFALFMSVVPGLLAALVFRLTRLRQSRWNAAMVYIIALVVVLMAQAWLRAW